MASPDPRLKILFCFCYAILVATAKSWEAVLWALVSSLFFAFLFRAWSFKLLKRLLLADFFLFFVVLTLPFTTPGESLARFGPLSLSREGLLLAAFIFCKSNAILLTTYVFLAQNNAFELAHALHHLHLPSGLVQLLFFTLRYLELLQREFRRLLEAAKLRGFVPRTALRSYRGWAYLFASLFLRSYDRSKRVYEAMLLRGYRGYFPVWHHFSWARSDLFWLLGGGIYLVSMAILAYR